MAFTRPRAAQINFDATNISDTLIRINSAESGDNANDLGIVFERGNHTNAAIIWDESADAFRLISTTHDSSTTTSDIDISAHHNLHVGTLEASSISIGSTAVTSTATELNLLDGVTGITLGNANELLVVGSDGTSIITDSVLTIDADSNYIGINQTSPEVTLHMTGDGAQTAQIRMEQHNDTADAPDLRTRRSRGTAASPSNLSAGDYLFRINAEAYQSGTYATLGSIQLDTSSSDVSKGVIQFQTHNGSSLATRLQILDSGAIRFNSAYTFPTADGSANQILTTNGSGVLSFASPASSSFTLAADSGTSDSFSTGGTLTFEGGTGVDTTVSNDQISIAIDSTVTTLTGTQTLTNKTLTSPTINDPTFGGVLAFNSTSTTVSPLTLTANSLNDNVGALRINGSEPDIYLNQAASGFTTVTFARTISSVVQPMVGFGKDSSDNLYMFRETAQDAANTTVYDNTSFVLNRSTGNISMAHDLAVTGEVSYGTLNDGTTTLTSTVAELNILDGVTATASELNRLDGINSAAVGLTDTQTLTNKTLTSAQVTTDIRLNARAELEFYDTDSSHYVAFRAPATVASSLTWTLPASDGTADQVLATNGAGTLSWADAGAGGGGGSGSSFPNSTFQTVPGTDGNFDMSFNVAQTTQETPFEASGTDAFGVNLGSVFSLMDPVGTLDSIDYGDGEAHVGA